MTDAAERDAQAAYTKLLPDAEALPSDDVCAYYLDPEQVLGTVRFAMQVLVAYKNQIPKHLPRLKLPVLEALPALALAVKYSVAEAEKAAPDEQALRHTVAEARQLRSMIRPIVAGLAANRIVPPEHHEESLWRTRPRDVAIDCLSLSAVFRTYELVLRNKHAADPNLIHRLGNVGSFLLEHLRPIPTLSRDTKTTPPSPPLEPRVPAVPAIDRRDRFETLLVERYGKLRVVARYFCGEEYERFTPPLLP